MIAWIPIIQPKMDMVIQVEKYYNQSGHFILHEAGFIDIGKNILYF